MINIHKQIDKMCEKALNKDNSFTLFYKKDFNQDVINIFVKNNIKLKIIKSKFPNYINVKIV